jgi:hypothetical protein
MPTTNNGQKPDPPHRADTDSLVADVLAANADCGAALDPEERFRQMLTTFVTQVRENGNGNSPPPKGLKHPVTAGLIKYVLTALFTLGVAYGGIKWAVKSNADDIKAVDTKVEIHAIKSAHAGAVTKVEIKPLEDKVQALDKSVGELGVLIGQQEIRQKERHDDIKSELKYLRRRRRND